jgi:hypothetical protein
MIVTVSGTITVFVPTYLERVYPSGLVEYTQYTTPTELGIVVCGLRFTFTLTRLLSNVRVKKTGVHKIKSNVFTLQFKKAVSPMEVTVEGITAEIKLLQPENALVPIAVTEEGRSTEAKLIQF